MRLVNQAEEDLAELVKFIADHDCIQSANHVLDKLLAACEGLEHYPDRGRQVSELLPLGIKSYREAHFGPYRIIYEVIGRNVFVMLIVDGRRSLQSILERRLLR